MNQKDPDASENQAEKASKFPAAVNDLFAAAGGHCAVSCGQLFSVYYCWTYQPVIIVGTV